MSNITIKKTNGQTEPFSISKILRWSEWASFNCEDVSLESVLTEASAKFYDTMTTDEITKALCTACEELSAIAGEQQQYSLVRQYSELARNLYIPSIIKKVYRYQSQFLNKDSIYLDQIKVSDNNTIPLPRFKFYDVLKLNVEISKKYDSVLLNR